ncbi:MAG: substrate-binding domain-containing protein [Spirochaetales bacterium]|nr:substrate-binding domain-containing protein [Spirochaetales bacterium]
MIRLAVFAPSYPDEIFLSCFQGLKSAQRILRARNIDVELCFFDNNLLPYKIDYSGSDARIFLIARSDSFDGIITLGGILSYTKGPLRFTDFLKDNFAGKPVINCMSRLEGIPSIYLDNVAGIHKVVDHLVQTHGYRRIAILNGIKGHPDSELRRQAFIERMAYHNLEVAPEWDIDGNYQVEGGERTALAWIKIHEKGIEIPQALIACNDDMAFGFISKFNEHNSSSPHRIPLPAVCGFDNRDFCLSVSPTISSVSHPILLQAKQSLFLMTEHLMNGIPLPMDTLVEPELIIRNSCGCTAGSPASASSHYQQLSQSTLEVVSGIAAGRSDIQSTEQIFPEIESLYYEALLVLGQQSVFMLFNQVLETLSHTLPEHKSEEIQERLKIIRGLPDFLAFKIREYNIRIREHRRNVLMLQEALHAATDEFQFPQVLSRFSDQFNLSKAAIIIDHELSPRCGRDQLMTICMTGEIRYCAVSDLCAGDFITMKAGGNKLFCGLQTGKTGFGYMIFDVGDASLAEAREIARGIGARLIEFHRTRHLLDTERYAGLGKLLEGFAHHINTPLGNTVTAVSVMENRLNMCLQKKTALTEDDILTLHQAAVITEHNIEMIREMVDLFRRLSSVSEYHTWETGTPEQLLYTSFQSETINAGQFGVRLEVQYRTGKEPFPFPADSIRFVLHELIENSIKYAFEEKREADACICIIFSRNQNSLVITVADNGKGIPEGKARKLFTPFNRMGKRSDGLGMGLFAAKRIVTGLLSGTMEVLTDARPGFHLKMTIPIPVLRAE